MLALPENSFAELLIGLKAGSQTAAEEVFRLHYQSIVAIIHKRIDQKYRAKIDAESIVNSTLKSFFRAYTGDRLAMSDWQELWNLLVAIAVNKLKNRYRWLNQQRRDASREVGEEGLDLGTKAVGPEEELLVLEALETATVGYTEQERNMIEMSLQGYLVAEVAADLGVSGRTVIRIRKDFQRKLETMQKKEESE